MASPLNINDLRRRILATLAVGSGGQQRRMFRIGSLGSEDGFCIRLFSGFVGFFFSEQG